MPSKQKKSKPQYSANTADRHELYELAVQSVASEIDMVDETYTQIRGRHAHVLREDFCGTANTSCEWIRRRPENTAIGLDLNQEVLDWGLTHRVSRLDEVQQQRIELFNQDVLSYQGRLADIIVAMNFSYQIFKNRDTLRQYFSQARAGLNDNGMFFIDAFGGHDSWRNLKEKTRYNGFTYYWHQTGFDPITANMVCHIHFKFPDGSKIKKAFTYEWRIWTLPEIRELLDEAGFSKVTVYWEGTDEETGKGNGCYFPAERGEDDPAWITYLSAEK